jgi:hypothetical protein
MYLLQQVYLFETMLEDNLKLSSYSLNSYNTAIIER